LIPALVAALMLLGAVAGLPYGYYQFLRWVVCGIGIYVAVIAYRWGITWVTWVFGAIAVLFNPVIPITFSREIWLPIDIASSLIFSFSIFFLKKPIDEGGVN